MPKNIDVNAQCKSAWDSNQISGKYSIIGTIGDYACYGRQKPDANGNWWRFVYDHKSSGWIFRYSKFKIAPGQSISGSPIESADRSKTGKFRNIFES